MSVCWLFMGRAVGAWIIRGVTVMVTDRNDHIWVISRPRVINPDESGAATNQPRTSSARSLLAERRREESKLENHTFVIGFGRRTRQPERQPRGRHERKKPPSRVTLLWESAVTN